MPAPRGLPFYGLDHPPGVLDRVLSELADLGIFRHYSHVLDLTGGLGGPARWLARRHGCRVTAVEGDPLVADAAAMLTAEAHLADRVSSVVGLAEALPFAASTFTHAWRIETSPSRGDRGAIFAEAWRVLRPGAWLAVVGATSAELAGAGFREPAGFALEPLLEDDSTAARLVADRVAAMLGDESAEAERAALRPPLTGWRARKPA
ncbi:MAG: class I SAM-dependent methyltransferase [Candidatus Binatia bacterium]